MTAQAHRKEVFSFPPEDIDMAIGDRILILGDLAGIASADASQGDYNTRS